MTDAQRRGIAAGFLHVLSTTPNDAAAICTLVADTLSLADVPTAEDLRAMAQHIDEALRGKAEELLESDSRVPRHVGFLAYMQNRSDGKIDDVQLHELLELSRLTTAR